VVYYTGSPVTQPNVVNVAPPLSFSPATEILGLSLPYNFAIPSDTSDAYAATVPAYAGLGVATGMEVLLGIPNFGSNTTTTPTFNMNGLGALTITKAPGMTALAPGDLAAGTQCLSGSGGFCVADITANGIGWTLNNPQTSSGGGGTVTLTGPVTGSGTSTIATTITPTGVSAGSFTNANITINAAGQVTAASNGSGGSGSISVNGTSVSSPNLNGTTPAAPSGSTNCTWAVSGSSVSCSVPTSSGSAITALTEDVTASGTGSVAATAVNLPGHIALTGTPSAGQVPTATSPTAATWQTPTGGGSATALFPCDIMAAAGTPCIAAHSVTRRMLASYTGSLFQLERASDSTTMDVGTIANGQVNQSAITSFCASTTCTFSIIFDQMNTPSSGNNLPAVGAQSPISFVSFAGGSLPVLAITDEAYRNRTATVNVPTGNSAITEYMVINNSLSATCCGTYGDMENHVGDDGGGTMFALAYSTGSEGVEGTGPGPWPGVDWENGVFLFGPTPTQTNLSILAKYATAGPTWELKSGDATQGPLTTLNNSAPPFTAAFEGGLSLGEGGDGSQAPVAFFEGAVIASTTSDATDNAIQANVATFYGDTVNAVTGLTGDVGEGGPGKVAVPAVGAGSHPRQ
jgi:non-reducing end alpha-L-arabinofuranosidase